MDFELSESGIEPYTTEGFDSKNWVLLIIPASSCMSLSPPTYYDLEHLWADGEPIDIGVPDPGSLSVRAKGLPSPSALRAATLSLFGTKRLRGWGRLK